MSAAPAGFEFGFRRMMAVLAMGLGLALLGVAMGLVYMDVRQMYAFEVAKSGDYGPMEPGSSAAPMLTKEDFQKWRDPAPIWVALLCGAFGSALVGSSTLVVLFEFRWFRGGVIPRPGAK